MKPRRYKILDGDLSELLTGAAAALSVRILAIFATFGFTILAARSLGSDLSGDFFLGLTVLAVLSKLARIGTDNAITKFVSANDETKDYSRVIGSQKQAQYLVAGTSIVAACFLAFFANSLAIYVFDKPRLGGILSAMSFGIPLVALTWVNAQALKGLKRTGVAVISTALITPLLAAIVLLFFSSQYGLVGVTWSYLAGIVVAYLFSLYCWERGKPKPDRPNHSFEITELLSASLPLMGVAVLNLIMVWSGTLILGIFGSSSDVALYTVANRTALLISFVLFAINAISAPKFSQLFARQDLEAMQRVYILSTKLLILTAAPITLVIVIFPGPILNTFGSDFQGGYQVLIILSLGQFFNAATGSVATILMMSNLEKTVRNNATVATFANLTLNILLIPSMGIVGAAIATCSSLVLQNCLNAYSVWGNFRISPLQIFIRNTRESK